MDYKEVLVTYADYFEQSGVFSSGLRTVGWLLVQLLQCLCDTCQDLWDACFETLNFTEIISQQLGDYYYIL